MNSVRDTLLEFVSDSKNEFNKYHEGCELSHFEKRKQDLLQIPSQYARYLNLDYDVKKEYEKRKREISEAKEALKRFLNATNDEVRLRKAEEFADFALSIVDMRDSGYFRRALLRREVTGDIDYLKQRDHAAHTVNNYLLGWYIFDQSTVVQDQLHEQFIRRFGNSFQICSLPGCSQSSSKKEQTAKCFGDAWHFTSLLHDIGYLFEGILPVLSTEVKNDRVKRGAEIVHEYFNHRFWLETKLDSQQARKTLSSFAEKRGGDGIAIPDFSVQSIAAVGDLLCSTGDVSPIVERMDDKSVLAGVKLSIDAFDLWFDHYSDYGRPQSSAHPNLMVKRIEHLKTAYRKLMFDGLPGTYDRLLDHGVCGGLLQLLYTTFFYRIYFYLPHHIDHIDSNDFWTVVLWKFIKIDSMPPWYDYWADWWYKIILWATAAAALHNFPQFFLNTKWPGCDEVLPPLSIEEDALTYMGLLVDLLQEWDRYKVIPDTILGGKLPLQSNDVKLSAEYDLKRNKTIIIVDYEDVQKAKTVKDSLDGTLKDWRDIIRIEGL